MTTKIFSIFMLMITGFSFTSENTIDIQHYNQYCNARFDYCLDYPKFLVAQPESENGDGRIFKDKNGVEVLRVFGRLNLDQEGETISLEKQYHSDIQDYKAQTSIITYKKLGKTFFVLSGYRNGKIFYQKTILKKDAFAFAILQYSKSEKAIYDKVSTEVFKSLR